MAEATFWGFLGKELHLKLWTPPPPCKRPRVADFPNGEVRC